MQKISGVVITYNEEKNILKCLESMKDLVDEIIVVDSFSDDKTVEIAESYGAKVFKNEFLGHVEQKNYAMSLAENDLILALDADEWVSDELAASIKNLRTKSTLADGYIIKRKNFFQDKWIHGGIWKREYRIRLFRRSKAEWNGFNPHDKIVMNNKSQVESLEGHLNHYPYKSISEYVIQMDKFSEISAQAYYKKGRRSSIWKILWNPTWRFLWSYIGNLGFKDGVRGFTLCVIMATYTFLKYVKLYFLQKSKPD